MITQTELDKERIKYHSNAKLSERKIIERYVKSWIDEDNETRNSMIESDNYYVNKKLDIDKKKRFYLGKDGRPIMFNNSVRKNNILKHNYFKKLVDQKIDYLLSNGVEANTQDNKLQEELDTVVTESFHKRLANVGREAVKKGIAWWQIYYNEKGELKYKKIPSEEIIPLWKDNEHDKLDAVIRVYLMQDVAIDRTIEKIKVEVYTEEGVKYFEFKENKLIQDTDKPYEESKHFMIELDGVKEGISWGKIPFVYFKYNDEESSLLDDIKSLQDDYNLKRSEFSDVLSDVIRDILIFKNYGGLSLAEANEGIFKHFGALVDADGGVDTLSVNVKHEAHKLHVDMLKDDIYELGRGVNLDDDKFGNSPSGIALKILYSDLDMDCNKFAMELKSSLSYFFYFVIMDRYSYSLSDEEVDEMLNSVEYVFTKNAIVNDKELIETVEKSNLSERTKIERNPYAAKDEFERLEQEEKEKYDTYPVGDIDELLE